MLDLLSSARSRAEKKIIYYIIIQKIASQAESGKYFQIWFFPDLGGKNGGVLSMRMQVILDSSFARQGSAAIWGGKKGESRDWTNQLWDIVPVNPRKNRASSELLYKSNRPQVSMGYITIIP